MAGGNDIRAGKSFVEIYVKKSALMKGLEEIKGQMQGLGTSIMKVGGSLMGVGASILGPIVAAVAKFTEMGSVIDDISKRTGMSAGGIAELKYAAEQSGTGIDKVEASVKKMQKTLSEAEGGSKGAVEALANIGLTAADMAGKLPEDQLQLVAERLAEIEDPAKRTAAAMEVLGKGGTDLLPMVGELAALRKEARDLGLVPTDQAVADAAKLGDLLDSITSVVMASVFEIGAAMAPILIPMLEAFKNISATVTKWVRENHGVVQTVAAIGAGLVAVGAIITAVGAAIFGVGAAFGVVATVISTTVGAVVAVFATLTSPVLLLTAALGGALYAWLRFTDSGKASVSSFAKILGQFRDTIMTTFGGVADALKAGDFVLAGQIAMKGLQLVFLQGVQWISELIGGRIGGAIGDIGTKLIKGDLTGAWATAVGAMAVVWEGLVSAIVESFGGIGKALVETWEGATATITNSILEMSAQGGTMGAIASSILGVDISEEQARADLDRQKKLQLAKRELAKAEAINSSSSSTDQERADAQVRIKNANATIAAGGQVNVLADAKELAEESIHAAATGIRDVFHDFDPEKASQAYLDAQNAGSALKIGMAAGGAGNATNDEITRLTQELATLRKQAADAAANANGGVGNVGPIGGDVENLVSTAGLKSGFVTTSGAALLAGGRSYGVADKQVKVLEKIEQLNAVQIEKDDAMLRAFEQQTRFLQKNLAMGQ